MKQDFIEKIYAGWLAKIIGIRLGAPVELRKNTYRLWRSKRVSGRLPGFCGR